MHFNGETWLRILILLFGLIVSVSCLRGSELVRQAAKNKQAAASANVTAPEEQVSDAEGTNSTTTGDSNKPLLTGIPQIDYIHDPNLPRELNGFNLSDYPFYNSIPKGIEFKCDGLHDGFYASVPHHCQVYHHCLYGIRYDFLCANYTAFDQKTFICHFVSEIDCPNSPKYYQRNEALYKAATTIAPVTQATTTTKATTEAPKKADEDGRRPGPFRDRPRRPPYRRRPAEYDYYDNREDYDDDYYYYDPPARKRPNRNKGYRGDYYGGERAGGHKSIHRDPPRRKPLKSLYEDEDEDYEYYYDSVDGSKDDDNRRRPLDNNYRKPVDRDRPYLNKKRDKDIYNRDRNDKKKTVEDDYGNSRKNDDDRRIRNKYKGFTQRSKFDRDEDDLEDIDNSRRYEDDKRDKYLKNRPEPPKRPKLGKTTTPFPDEEDYEDVVAPPKRKNRFPQRKPAKEESSKKPDLSNSEELEGSNGRKGQNSDRAKESNKDKSQDSNDGLPVFNPQIYARRPSKLYSQVKVETRPPPVQRNKDLPKPDGPVTTTSSYKRPFNNRSGNRDRGSAEVERPKPTPKYTTPSSLELDDYEEEDSLLEDTEPAKSYYEEEVSETYLNEQFPSRTAPVTQQASRNYRDQSQTDTQAKNGQRNKSTFSQRFKPSERQTNSFSKQETTERPPTKPVTENQFDPIQSSEESPASFKPHATERKPTTSERQPQTLYQRQPYPERQSQTEKQQASEREQPSERQSSSERQQPFERQPPSEREQFSERQPPSERQQPSDRQSPSERQQPFERQSPPERQQLSERQPPSERQQFSERQPPSERQQFSERQPPSERQQFSERQPPSERQPLSERQHLTERQPFSERQPLYERQPMSERQQFSERQPFARQPVTERLIPFQRQPVTDRQVLAYVKQPVTDRQLVAYKQIVTERQILPYLRQAELERKPVPFPKQPPRTFEITAPGPSGLGGRIDVSDSIQRDKYVIPGDRPTGFSLRLPQTDYSNPLQHSTQIQRRPEEPSPEKIVTRPPFKPVRNYRAKPTPEPQYHDSIRLETFPQRYITRTEDYEPVVQNPRLSVIPQISHVTNTKEWYW